MKVLVLTTVMAPYRVALFNELSRYCDLTVCFEQKHDSSRDEKWYADKVKGFKCVGLKGWQKPVDTLKPDILNHLNKTRYDIAVAYEYSTKTAFLFMLGCRMKRIPYVINCDGGFVNRHRVKDLIKSFSITGAKAFFASGNKAKKYLMAFGALEQAIFIHKFSSLCENDILETPLLPDKKFRLKQELDINCEKKVVLSVGQFIHRKGYDVLLKAWKEFCHDDSVQLVIIGGGPKQNEYNDYIVNNELKNVIITGFHDKEQLFKYYKSADLFVLPTREDIWGLVVNEAMACGLPVITTDNCVAGLELISDSENGYIVPVDDSLQLSDKITKVLRNDKLRESMSVRSLIKIKEYTIENMAKRHFEVFTQIINGNNFD